MRILEVVSTLGLYMVFAFIFKVKSRARAIPAGNAVFRYSIVVTGF